MTQRVQENGADTMKSEDLEGARPMGEIIEEMTDQLVKRVVELCRPTIRKVIGDSTPAQYDRADEMAQAIASAVRRAVAEEGPDA